MTQKSQDDPYSEFVLKHGQLAAIADAVLEGVVEYASLKEKDEFAAELDRLSQEQKTRQGRKSGFVALERLLRSPQRDQIMVRRFTLICRAAEVAFGHTPWHHQIVAAILLHEGKIVEMPNGSGKTLAGALAAALNGLQGQRTHVATSNDYLAERDMRWMGRFYQLLGLSVGVIFTDQCINFQYGILGLDGKTLRAAPRTNWSVIPANQLPSSIADDRGNGDLKGSAIRSSLSNTSDGIFPSGSLGEAREHDSVDAVKEAGAEEPRHETVLEYEVDTALTLKAVFESDVVYGRIEAFGFAYLNDHLKFDLDEQIFIFRDALLVDECDLLLLDDLRTPLVVTRERPNPSSSFQSGTLELHDLAQLLILLCHSADGFNRAAFCFR